MTTYSVDALLENGNLLKLEDVKEVLAKEEPLDSLYLEDDVSFRAGESWESDLLVKQGRDPVDAFVAVGSTELQMTLEAATSIVREVGLTAAYMNKSPSALIFPQLNYWFSKQPVKQAVKLLVGPDKVVRTVANSTVDSFSNLRLIDSITSAVYEKFGETQIYADTKFHHSLQGTYLRLVIPERNYLVSGTDVENDEWCLGIQLKNSLVGKSPQTMVDGYLFRYWCTNGAIDRRNSVGGWSRRSSADSSEVYPWIKRSAAGILDAAETAFVGVQHLAETPAEGVSSVFQDLFERYSIPVRLRSPIIESALDHSPTMYEVMQAITSAANISGQRPDVVEHLMSVGGALATVQADRCDGCHRML